MGVTPLSLLVVDNVSLSWAEKLGKEIINIKTFYWWVILVFMFNDNQAFADCYSWNSLCDTLLCDCSILSDTNIQEHDSKLSYLPSPPFPTPCYLSWFCCCQGSLFPVGFCPVCSVSLMCWGREKKKSFPVCHLNYK